MGGLYGQILQNCNSEMLGARAMIFTCRVSQDNERELL